MSKPKNPNWSTLKAILKNWPSPGLLGLLHELYNLSGENRTFLHARLMPDNPEASVGKAKRKLQKLLSVTTVFNGHFKHSDAKGVIDEYAKANDDPAPLADLLMTDLEISFATFYEVGDFEAMVDHLYASLWRLDKVMAKLPSENSGPFQERASELAKRWDGCFGYGISDEMVGFAQKWSQQCEISGEKSPIG